MSLLQQAPRFTADAAAAIARERFGLDAAATPLPSERDQNFRLRTGDGLEFVLKFANALESGDLLRAQNAAMAHLAVTGLCPRAVSDLQGDEISRVTTSDGATHLVRLVTWIPGVPFADVHAPDAALFEDLGRAMGEIDRALASFDHAAIRRDFYWDLAHGARIVRERSVLVSARDLRVLVGEIALRFARDTAPLLPALRRSAIHNDPNDRNVIVRGGRVVGIIDFGDMVHGWTAGDLAIAIAYAVLDETNPAATAEALRRGYESVNPLTHDERTALFGLVRLRLAMSVCIAASQQRERPDDPYLTSSQHAIRRTLPALMDLT